MKTPTKEQLADPVWWDEVAPEWATHYQVEDDQYIPAFLECKGGKFTRLSVYNIVYEIKQGYNPNGCIFSRPTSSAWRGPEDGLPPVGAACEFYWESGDEWREGVYVASHGGRMIVCDREYEDCAERLEPHFVRPIRTPEQIAAEERERVIEEMMKDKMLVVSGVSPNRAVCEAWHNAGYRKQEKQQ